MAKPLSPPLLEALKRGAQFHQAGRLDKAQALYQKVMQKAPSLVEPPYLLGSIAFDRERFAYAQQLAEDALKIRNDYAPAHLLRGNALAALGQHAKAEGAWRRSLELEPQNPAAHVNLALRLCELGHGDDALHHAQQALAQDRGLYRAHYAAGLALRLLNKLHDAELALSASLQLAPRNVEVLRAHGQVLLQMGETAAALRTLDVALSLSPEDQETRLAYAEALLGKGDLSDAEALLRRLATDMPGEAVWNALGELLRTTGRFEEAAQAYREALACAPLSPAGLSGLARAKVALRPEDIAALEAAAGNQSLAIATRASLLHALGRRLEAEGKPDESFISHATAKRLLHEAAVASGRAFDSEQFARAVDGIIATWTPDRIKGLGAHSPGDGSPVFIVGLPRSGTTLVEQLVASHPDTLALGETMSIPSIAAKLTAFGEIEHADPGRVAALAEAHLVSLRGLSPHARRFLDKQLDNIFSLGLIGALFPKAKVLLCQRDLRDQGLSTYMQEFPGAHNEFLDLRDIGLRALHTQRLARHWLATSPVAILPIQYESVVADLEGQARAILDFLDLPWDPACLAFHETHRRVTTSSAWQVRQPLYDKSVGRWRQYEAHLGPLLEALGDLAP